METPAICGRHALHGLTVDSTGSVDATSATQFLNRLGQETNRTTVRPSLSTFTSSLCHGPISRYHCCRIWRMFECLAFAYRTTTDHRNDLHTDVVGLICRYVCYLTRPSATWGVDDKGQPSKIVGIPIFYAIILTSLTPNRNHYLHQHNITPVMLPHNLRPSLGRFNRTAGWSDSGHEPSPFAIVYSSLILSSWSSNPNNCSPLQYGIFSPSYPSLSSWGLESVMLVPFLYSM